jgi:hypothetical protein
MIVRMMQDNMQQQHLATKNAEQMIAATYGQVLAPRLGDRHLTMSTIDQMMRESIGKINAPQATQQQEAVE